VVRRIRAGNLDGAALTGIGMGQIHRAALVFQMPGMFRGYEQLDGARNAVAGDVNAGFEAAGFELLGWADVGESRIFSQRPVHTPQELAAMHPLVWRDDLVLPALYDIIHAHPLSLGIPDGVAALQGGRGDALITSPVAAVSLGWAPHVHYMTDLRVAVLIGATVISRNVWNTLTPEEQAILRETSQEFHAEARQHLRADEQTAVTSLASHGVAPVTLDAGQRAAWESVFEQTRQRLTGQIADAAFVQRIQQLGR
jgi:TRAP-type C4-dicarboxylate transport system substrate-binding protein